MVDIEAKILPPPDIWLEPCLIVECEIKTPPNQCIFELRGLLLTEDGKIVSELEEIPEFLEGDKEVDSLHASDNYQFRELLSSKTKSISKFRFTARLSQRAIEHIEKLREKRLKRDVELKLRLLFKYVLSNVTTSHLHEISLNSLPAELKKHLQGIRIGKKGLESLIAYSYDPNFSPSRSNMWILSSNSGAKFISFYRGEKEISKRIPYDDWIHDFLPTLKAYTVVTIEVPVVEEVPSYEHLAKAVEELRHGERLLKEGRYDGVIRSVRNILMNHLLTDTKKVNEKKQRFLDKRIKELVLSNVPSEAKKEYKHVLLAMEKILRRLLDDHLSKFIHLDSEKLIRMPLKADAEYLLLTVTSILRYLSRLSSSSE